MSEIKDNSPVEERYKYLLTMLGATTHSMAVNRIVEHKNRLASLTTERDNLVAQLAALENARIFGVKETP